MKKIILIISLIFFIACAQEEKKEVILETSDLNAYGWSFSEDVCSSGLMGMMTDMGLMAYSMADFMGNMCSMMPFGGMCPDLGEIAARFFSEVLENPQLTLDLLDCADNNEGMRLFMLEIMAEHQWLLTKVAQIMAENDNESSCLFTEKFTLMSIHHEDARNFFFYFIDNTLWRAVTYANLCENNTSKYISELMRDYGAEEMQPDKPFAHVFMNIGTVEDSNDGNEMANERLYYSMFSKIETANNFLGAMANMTPEMQGAFMNFFFMGVQDLPAINCTPIEEMRGCVSRDAMTLNHEAQGYYNLYAVNKAFYNHIAPLYDITLPPDPNSENPANALFGNFMSMLITPQGEMTPFANRYFSVIITASSPPHCNEEAKGIMMMFQSMMEQGFIPFTVEEFQQMAPQLYNANAPSPRNFLDGSGDAIIGVCPDIPCAQDSAQGCNTIESCENLGFSWCAEYCSSDACPSCDLDHLTLCTDEGSCLTAGGNFCDNTCTGDQCEEELSCDNEHLELCYDYRSCIESNGNWCNNACSNVQCEENEELQELGEQCSRLYPCQEDLSCYRTYGDQFERCVIPAAEDEYCDHFYPCENSLSCEFNRDIRTYICKRLRDVGETCEWGSDCKYYLGCDYQTKTCLEYY